MKGGNGYPLELEKQYVRLVERYMAAIRAEAVKAILENTNFGEVDEHVKQVAVKDSIADVLRILQKIQINFENSPLLKKLQKATVNVFESVTNWTNRYNKDLIKKAGYDPEVFKLPNIKPEALKGVTEKNVALITSQGKEYLGVIEKNVKEFVTQAKGPRQLAALIEAETKATANQARMIASDQLRKAHSDIAKASQQTAGFQKYKWRTQKDGRVRDDHKDLEGLVFSWDDPPITNSRTGDENNPGEDFGCRCFAEPVFDDDESDSPAERLKAAISMTKKQIAMGKK
jgi:SPP1 gp7 family putative phage head morphogenesis protein